MLGHGRSDGLLDVALTNIPEADKKNSGSTLSIALAKYPETLSEGSLEYKSGSRKDVKNKHHAEAITPMTAWTINRKSKHLRRSFVIVATETPPNWRSSQRDIEPCSARPNATTVNHGQNCGFSKSSFAVAICSMTQNYHGLRCASGLELRKSTGCWRSAPQRRTRHSQVERGRFDPAAEGAWCRCSKCRWELGAGGAESCGVKLPQDNAVLYVVKNVTGRANRHTLIATGDRND